jgi:MraZ protein
VQEDNIHLEQEVSGLGMIVGSFVHSLDPKKRLTIPSVWRSQIGKPQSVYVMPDLHKPCLNLYPSSEMIRKLETLRQYAMGDEAAREAFREMGEFSEVATWDSQGRIRVSDRLLEFAGLDDRVVLVGALDRIELWSLENRPQKKGVDQDALRRSWDQVKM